MHLCISLCLCAMSAFTLPSVSSFCLSCLLCESVRLAMLCTYLHWTEPPVVLNVYDLQNGQDEEDTHRLKIEQQPQLWKFRIKRQMCNWKCLSFSPAGCCFYQNMLGANASDILYSPFFYTFTFLFSLRLISCPLFDKTPGVGSKLLERISTQKVKKKL